MVVITGTAAVTITLVSLIVGGGGVFVFLKYIDREDMPNIANSSFGTFDWEKTSKTDLIGVDFNLNSGGVIFEVCMIITFMFVIMLFCLCGCHHLPTPQCLKERRHKNRMIKRERYRKKKEMMREEEEREEERRRRKQRKRHMEHHRKMGKMIEKNHWAVRNIEEERRNEILRIARGEGGGQRKGVEKQVTAGRLKEESEMGGNSATMRTEDARRNSSMVDGTSLWSGTSGTSSSWYCGQDIHTEGSMYSLDLDEKKGEEKEGRNGSSSGSSNGSTMINMDQ